MAQESTLTFKKMKLFQKDLFQFPKNTPSKFFNLPNTGNLN